MLCIVQTKRHVDNPEEEEEEEDNITLEKQRISCQYPIMEIVDLSPAHTENINSNSWQILQPYPSIDEVNGSPLFLNDHS